MSTEPEPFAHERSHLPIRLSVLFFIGMLVAGSTALGYFYYFVYSPPIDAAELFMDAMESDDAEALGELIVISVGLESGDLRPTTDTDIERLLGGSFSRGRVLDQRKREGNNRSYHYLVYREPDGHVYALVVTEFEGRYRIVIPETQMSDRRWYLWDYTWTN